jgi:hypothetical protein
MQHDHKDRRSSLSIKPLARNNFREHRQPDADRSEFLNFGEKGYSCGALPKSLKCDNFTPAKAVIRWMSVNV